MDTSSRLLALSLEEVKKGEYEEAVLLLERALVEEVEPEKKRLIQGQLALCYIELSEYDKAELQLIDCLEMAEDVETYEILLIVYFTIDNIEKADGVCEKIIRLDCNHESANKHLLKRCYEAHMYEEAAQAGERLALAGLASAVDYVRLYYSYLGMLDLRKAFNYLRLYFKEQKGKKYDEFYINALVSSFFTALYEEVYDDNEYIYMTHEMRNALEIENTGLNTVSGGLFKELKIGLISSDFYGHPVGFFILSLLTHKFGNTMVKYYCYHTRTVNDALTDKIKELADSYVNISGFDESERETAIKNDGIDILIDLNGISAYHNCMLLAARSAPIQLSWIGTPGTTGIPNVDYTLVDPVTDPEEYAQQLYTEKLLYMSKTFLCYSFDTNEEITAPPCLRNRYITFGSFGNVLKNSECTLRMWARLMAEMPDARLTITASDIAGSGYKPFLKRKIEHFGLDISRISFVEHLPYFEYLKYYNNVDIVLDTYPFNGATTMCDSLYMGVPFVSLYGRRHVSRVGLSLLNNVSLSDLAVSNEDEYVNVCIRLASDTNRLVYLRENLRGIMKKSPLGDSFSFKRELENKLRGIYIARCMEQGENAEKLYTDEHGFNSIVPGLELLLNMTEDNEAFKYLSYIKHELVYIQRRFISWFKNSVEENSEKKEFISLLERVTRGLYRETNLDGIRKMAGLNLDIFGKMKIV